MKSLAWGVVRQNTLLHKMVDGQCWEGGREAFLVSKYNRLCKSSYSYHEEYLRRGGHLQEVLVIMKILNSHVLCGGSNEPSALTARSVGLKTPSWSQLGSPVEKKNVTPEDVRAYPMTAHRVSRNGGRLKGNIKNFDSES
jgi:hypothetical protein